MLNHRFMAASLFAALALSPLNAFAVCDCPYGEWNCYCDDYADNTPETTVIVNEGSGNTTVVQVQPVVVIERPVVYGDDTVYNTPNGPVFSRGTPESNTAYQIQRTLGEIQPRFSIGLRGVGMTQNDIVLKSGERVETTVLGGGGYYLFIKLVRYISIDIYNDYIFGSYKNHSGTFMKAPFSFGLRGHFLDFGRLDVYIAAAVTGTWVSLFSGGNLDSDDLRTRMDVTSDYMLFGGQFGGGINYTFGGPDGHAGLLLGVDVRYYIEQSHEDTVFGKVNGDKPSQGVAFSLCIGAAFY